MDLGFQIARFWEHPKAPDSGIVRRQKANRLCQLTTTFFGLKDEGHCRFNFWAPFSECPHLNTRHLGKWVDNVCRTHTRLLKKTHIFIVSSVLTSSSFHFQFFVLFSSCWSTHISHINRENLYFSSYNSRETRNPPETPCFMCVTIPKEDFILLEKKIPIQKEETTN